jgi:hypothetical protein
MAEKRQISRFAIQIPAQLVVDGEDGPQEPCDYLTRDISSKGAFLITDNPLPVGTRLSVQFSIEHRSARSKKTLLTRLKTTGQVIRNSLEGMAIYFDRQCKILAS